MECVELPADSDKRDVMALRGEVLPFVRLRQLFTIARGPAAPRERGRRGVRGRSPATSVA